jgi:hypothetical protein
MRLDAKLDRETRLANHPLIVTQIHLVQFPKGQPKGDKSSIKCRFDAFRINRNPYAVINSSEVPDPTQMRSGHFRADRRVCQFGNQLASE